jgi:hypothetical protein
MTSFRIKKNPFFTDFGWRIFTDGADGALMNNDDDNAALTLFSNYFF